MNQSSSKDKGREKYGEKIIGWFTVLAAIVTIIAYILPRTDKNIEKIRELLEEQKELTLFSERTVLSDSILNAYPTLKETSEIQSDIISYFQICDRLNFPSKEYLTDETKEIVCIQNLKILIELEEITQNINDNIQKLILHDPSVTTYLDMPSLERVNKTNKDLNEVLNGVYEKIGSISNEKEKVKLIWKFFGSKELYPALESKKDAYILLFKACEVVINKKR